MSKNKTYVSFPDGSTREKPEDGVSFIHNEDDHYIWDDFLLKWVDRYGKIWNPPSEDKGRYIKLDIEKPKNKEGCECGAWITGVSRHSQWCRLFRKDSWD